MAMATTDCTFKTIGIDKFRNYRTLVWRCNAVKPRKTEIYQAFSWQKTRTARYTFRKILYSNILSQALSLWSNLKSQFPKSLQNLLPLLRRICRVDNAADTDTRLDKSTPDPSWIRCSVFQVFWWRRRHGWLRVERGERGPLVGVYGGPQTCW